MFPRNDREITPTKLQHYGYLNSVNTVDMEVWMDVCYSNTAKEAMSLKGGKEGMRGAPGRMRRRKMI